MMARRAKQRQPGQTVATAGPTELRRSDSGQRPAKRVKVFACAFAMRESRWRRNFERCNAGSFSFINDNRLLSATMYRPISIFDAMLSERNNFDLLRLLAALGVVLSHAYPVTQGSNASEILMVLSGGQSTLGEVCVMAFFVISGFLITQSFARSRSVIDYMSNRVLRIVPGLAVMALLTSCVLGPLVTTLPAETYWTSRATYRFLANGLVYNTAQWLPGVFSQNIYPNVVNASLWTLAYEFSCYTAVASVGLALRRAWLPALLLTLVTVASVFLTWISPRLFLTFGSYFLAGSVAYLARRRIPLDGRLFVFSVVVLAATLISKQGLHEALLFFGSYIILWLAFRPVPSLKGLARQGDFSYGVYIYAFPIQQVLAPVIATPVWNFLLSTPLILLCAVLSWYLVEKPALACKRQAGHWVKGLLGIPVTRGELTKNLPGHPFQGRPADTAPSVCAGPRGAPYGPPELKPLLDSTDKL